MTQKFHSYIPMRNENTRPQKNFYVDTHSSILHKIKRQKQASCPSAVEWISKRGTSR